MWHEGWGFSLKSVWRLLIASSALLATLPAASYAESGSAAVGWGGNRKAELNAGYRSNYEQSPEQVVGLTNIKEIAPGAQFTVALLSDGTVRAWGNNGHGQLGDGTGGKNTGTWIKGVDDVTVSGLSEVKSIAVANEHDLALLENGTVKAWGYGDYGQLGNGKSGPSEGSPAPQTVAGLSGVIAVAAGGGSDYALLSNHTVMAWGEDGKGQLGIGETGPEKCTNEVHQEVGCETKPRAVVAAGGGVLEHVLAISAGEENAYAVLENGHVMAWGTNVDGQLGSGGELLHTNPVPQVVKSAATGEALASVIAVSGGRNHALALLEGGGVLGWGAAGADLGETEATEKCKKISCVKTARPIKGLEGLKVTDISAGETDSMVVSGGKVYSFGKNEQGELGLGTTTKTSVPTVVGGIGAVSSVVAGDTNGIGKNSSFAVLESGVSPPAPVLGIEPGIDSLNVVWKLPAPEYELEYVHRSAEESEGCEVSGEGGEEPEEGSEEGGETGGETCEHESEKSEEGGKFLGVVKLGAVQHYDITGLEGEAAYLVIVKSHNKDHLEKKRVIFGTTLF
jgi:alpha-tubulin suppressor-like RCC1 family protein